jgi:Protein of unknown function (DUF3667)
MRHLRKGHQCLNCHAEMDEVYNFCPHCGQQNTNNRVSVKELLGDLFNNYLNFDSRFARSIIPFLFKPGLLTNTFNGGQRVFYIHPVRLYVFMSLICFFVVLKVADLENSPINVSRKQLKEAFRLDSLQHSKTGQKDSIGEAKQDSTQSADEKESKKDKLKRILKRNQKGDSASSALVVVDKPDAIDSLDLDPDSFIFPKVDIERFLLLISEEGMTPEVFLDSVHIKNRNEITMVSARQILKIGRNDFYLFAENTINNIAPMMFFLLPLFAVYMTLLYWRRERLYIEHFVFTLHLQSFVFFCFAVLLAIAYWADAIEMIIWAFPLTFIYAYLAFLRVYKQHWFKTFIKFFLLSNLYLFTLLVFMSIEVLISFYLY